METVIKIIFTALLMVFTIFICILNAHKSELWEAIYKKLGLK